MREIAVVGAGELGGAVAHVLARRDIARSILLVDDDGRVASGKALDIAQAAPVEGFAAQIAGTSDIASAAGASAIIVADRVAGGQWSSEEGMLLIKRLVQSAPAAAIVCAGDSSRHLIERSVTELRVARHRLFGSAPEALASGARALVALSANGSPRDVALTVLGVPPDRTVIPWEEATIAGFALTRQMDEPSRRRIAARVARLWPPGPHALAAAAAAVIDAMRGGSRRTLSVFVGPDVSAGTRAHAAALPVRLNASGIAEVLQLSLSVVEQVALENAIQL